MWQVVHHHARQVVSVILQPVRLGDDQSVGVIDGLKNSPYGILQMLKYVSHHHCVEVTDLEGQTSGMAADHFDL